MLFATQADRPHLINRDRLLRLALLAITTILACVALVFPYSLRQSSFPLKVGDVVPQDIQAPSALTYTSEVLSAQSRETALANVPPVFIPTDPTITRRQIEKLRSSLYFITSIRADPFASTAQKNADLAAMTDLPLRTELSERILSMSDSRWQIIQGETLSVLEQVMRNTIREGQTAEALRNIPTLISFSIPQDQAAIINELVAPFVVANSLYSQEMTNQARQETLKVIEPVQRTYAAGEIIVRRGQIITPTAFEALQAFGLIQIQGETQTFLASATLSIMAGILVGLYVHRRRISVFNRTSNLLLIAGYFLLLLFSARFMIPNRTIVPYLFPIGAFGLTIGSLFAMEIGMVFSIFMGILAAYGMPNGLDLTVFYILSSLAGILILAKGRRMISFFYAGLAIGVTGAAVILSYRIAEPLTDAIGLTTLIGACLLNGLASASLTLLFQSIFAQLLGLTTALQLLDLSRPDHPLLQFLLRNAPGTYQHSLQVSNLAEQAAEAINADALLVRVGCLYHDAGKAMNPSFFVENQIPGKIDSHDSEEPAVISATIINHVLNGVEMAKKHRVPPRIQDFMREHHGTLLTRYQYAKALEAAGGKTELVDPEKFRYPGPKPRSRETVLLMLADGCEAKARADLPKTEDDLRKLIRKVVDYLQSEGQFDDTALTLHDLHLVTESFVKTMRNTYHPRLSYPEIKTAPVNPQTSTTANQKE